MTKDKKSIKSIPEEIFEEMSSKLTVEDGFDAEMIGKLQKLYVAGGFKKAENIIGIIRPKEE